MDKVRSSWQSFICNFSWVISVGIDTKHCYNMNPLTKHLPILKSFCGFLISQEMCKVNIPNKMQCSLGAQCHRGRLFNPEEITVLEHNHTLLKLNIELVGIYLTLMFKFELQQNKNDWILYSETRLISTSLDYLWFCGCNLEFANCSNPMYDMLFFFTITCSFVLLRCCVICPPQTYNHLPLYKIDTLARQGKPFKMLAMCGVSILASRPDTWLPDSPDPPLHQAPVIHIRKKLICSIGFIGIPTIFHMPAST